MKKVYGIVTGLALALGMMAGVVSAEERFSMLKDIPAKAMSTDEMDAVQG